MHPCMSAPTYSHVGAIRINMWTREFLKLTKVMFPVVISLLLAWRIILLHMSHLMPLFSRRSTISLQKVACRKFDLEWYSFSILSRQKMFTNPQVLLYKTFVNISRVIFWEVHEKSECFGGTFILAPITKQCVVWFYHFSIH